MKCKFCSAELKDIFVDLGHSPIANSFLDSLEDPEVYYPLKVYICECGLVQLPEHKKAVEIFDKNYIYFSSFSNDRKAYVEMVTERFKLNESSLVMEVASNDGYLLQHFKVPTLGIEPSDTAVVAISKGIKTIRKFFTNELAQTLAKADLIICNNVLAHVPDINNFVSGLKSALKEKGTIILEFPSLLKLIANNYFDTIYHEHFFYFSLATVKKILEEHGLEIFEVEEIPAHGGSFRVYVQHKTNVSPFFWMEQPVTPELVKDFQKKVLDKKANIVYLLSGLKKVIGYGATAKASTMLNFCGIKNIEFIVDRSPFKQGKFLPGSHIPVVAEDMISKYKPEWIIIFAWNIKDEIIEQLDYVKEWGCEFIIL